LQNVFYDSDTSKQMDLIQETYDLKGSTVSRNAETLKPGTHAICRYCRLEYTVGEKNIATPQAGDFVQLLADYDPNARSELAYCYDVVDDACTECGERAGGRAASGVSVCQVDGYGWVVLLLRLAVLRRAVPAG
jgi:hypothetical protein